MNRTNMYLVPALKYYGNEFRDKIHTVFKLAFGIGDILTIGDDVLDLHTNIFFLVDTRIDTPRVHSFQRYIREQPFYVKDYAYDNILTGYLHMFVIKFPEELVGAYDRFKSGLYSRMYTKEQIGLYFTDPTVKRILVKDNSYLIEFTEKLNTMFGTNVILKPEDISATHEFDLPLDFTDEIFDQEEVLRKLTECKKAQKWGN